MKRWSIIFKAFGNINRLKIVALLFKTGELSVGEIAEALKISIKSTSKNLVLLQQLNVLDSVGRNGHVYYNISSEMPKDIARTLKLFTE